MASIATPATPNVLGALSRRAGSATSQGNRTTKSGTRPSKPSSSPESHSVRQGSRSVPSPVRYAPKPTLHAMALTRHVPAATDCTTALRGVARRLRRTGQQVPGDVSEAPLCLERLRNASLRRTQRRLLPSPPRRLTRNRLDQLFASQLHPRHRLSYHHACGESRHRHNQPGSCGCMLRNRVPKLVPADRYPPEALLRNP